MSESVASTSSAKRPGKRWMFWMVLIGVACWLFGIELKGVKTVVNQHLPAPMKKKDVNTERNNAPSPSPQPPPASNNSVLLSQVPSTPTKVDCQVADNHTIRCIWPTQASDWILLGKVQSGFEITADPNGKVTDRYYQKYGVMGPSGLDYLCPNPQLRSKLPVPNAPPYAVVVKLGVDGEPMALTGRYGKSILTTEKVEIFVRNNDLPTTATEAYVEGLEGSLPILLKKEKTEQE